MKALIYIKKTAKKGWGVFAACNMHTGKVLEISPVLPFKVAQVKNRETFGLWNYQLAWRGKCDAVGLGYLTLYNHAADSNVSFTRNYKDKTITARIKKSVKAGEELTITYGCKLWFKEL